jgi:hypothetical protein
MICLLRKQRRGLGEKEVSSVFDKMFSDVYSKRQQKQLSLISGRSRSKDSKNDLIVSKSHGVVGTLHYMAPGKMQFI